MTVCAVFQKAEKGQELKSATAWAVMNF